MAKEISEARIRQIIQEEIKRNQVASKFNVTSVPQHIHNNVDSPFVFQPILTYIAFIPYDGSLTSGLEYILPTGWSIEHPVLSLSFTAAFVGGETSGTLTAAFNDKVASGYNLYIGFSNGDVRLGNFSLGSTSVTWTGALSGAASADVDVEAVGQYQVNHNLGTLLYSAVVIPTQSTNIYANAVVSPFTDGVYVQWENADLGGLADTSFYLILTQINNRKAQIPTYVSNVT